MSDRLDGPRWSHLALPCSDIQAAVDFYTTMTPLVVVDRFPVEGGETAWLANPPEFVTPFALVLMGLAEFKGRRHGLLAPFAHIGIEVPQREDVETFAQRGRDAGVLHWEPREMPDPIGYICAFMDPDGNVVEIAHGQRVFDTVTKSWAR